MGSRIELISPEGLRIDGRRAPELRKIKCQIGVLSSQADGSAYLEMGNTKVLVAVYGPHEPRTAALRQHDRATIDVDFHIATFASGERRKRSKQDRQLMELAHSIRQTFEPVLLTSQFPRSQISIYIQVLQLDGGTLPAAINASTLALIDAGIPMIDYVVACSAGCIGETEVCDLNYLEESQGVPNLTCGLLPKTNKVTLATLESARMHLSKFEKVLQLALDGCASVKEIIDEEVKRCTAKRAKTAV